MLSIKFRLNLMYLNYNQLQNKMIKKLLKKMIEDKYKFSTFRRINFNYRTFKINPIAKMSSSKDSSQYPYKINLNMQQILKNINKSEQTPEQISQQVLLVKQKYGENSPQFIDIVTFATMTFANKKLNVEAESYSLILYELVCKYPELRKNPIHQWVELKIAKFYYNIKNYKQAKKFYDIFLNTHFKKINQLECTLQRYMSYYELSHINLELKHRKQALQYYKKLMEIITVATENENGYKYYPLFTINEKFNHAVEYVQLEFYFGDKELAVKKFEKFIDMLDRTSTNYIKNMQRAKKILLDLKIKIPQLQNKINEAISQSISKNQQNYNNKNENK